MIIQYAEDAGGSDVETKKNRTAKALIGQEIGNEVTKWLNYSRRLASSIVDLLIFTYQNEYPSYYFDMIHILDSFCWLTSRILLAHISCYSFITKTKGRRRRRRKNRSGASRRNEWCGRRKTVMYLDTERKKKLDRFRIHWIKINRHWTIIFFCVSLCQLNPHECLTDDRIACGFHQCLFDRCQWTNFYPPPPSLSVRSKCAHARRAPVRTRT